MALALSGRAFSFPENVRHGYPSCAACHVSASGGGALTAYGRGSAEAFMSTWSYEGEAEPLHTSAAPLPSWLMIGGDMRDAGLLVPDPNSNIYPRRYTPINIPMQADLEIAVQPPHAKNLTFDVSAGVYGPEHTREYRRYYVKAGVSPTIFLKAGRFTPAYGINLPDHTSVTRAGLGLGEGQETFNVEGSWLAPRGELIATGIFGTQVMEHLGTDDRVSTLRTDDKVGGAVRAAVYPDSKSSAGVSFMLLRDFFHGRDAKGGLFAQTGLTEHLFVLSEVDRSWVPGMPSATVSLVKAGYEALPGLIVSATGETMDHALGARLGLQWQPRPHWELQLEWRGADHDSFAGLPRNSAVGLLHYWL